MNTISPTPSNLCHLYQRVSSGPQLLGTGLDRQYDNTLAYIERHGLEVVRTYSDRGVSAFRGKNRRIGELALILKHIESGIIRPGENLIIESVDRLSRQDPVDALDTFKEILRRGVVVHSVYEGSKFTYDDLRNMTKLMALLFSMGRANEESRYKSSRVADAHAKGRANGTIVAGSVPAWLELVIDKDKVKSFKVKPREKQIVKEMFELCADGMSSTRIARVMRDRGYQPFRATRNRASGSGKPIWYARVIQDIIKGRAVLGEFRSHTTSYDPNTGKRILTLASVNPNYYTAIIEPDLWQRANNALKSRLKARSRGRTGETFANILKDVVVCDHCRKSMNINIQAHWKTKERYTRLRCSGRVEHTCDNTKSPRYLAIENAILEFVSEIDLKDRRSEDVAAFDRLIASDAVKITDLETKIRNIITSFQGSPVAIQMVQEMEAEKASIAVTVAANMAKRDAIASRESPADRKAALQALRQRMATESGADLYATRAALNMKIKDVVDHIAFRKDGQHIVRMTDESVFYILEDTDKGLRVSKSEAPQGRDPGVEAAFEGAA